MGLPNSWQRQDELSKIKQDILRFQKETSKACVDEETKEGRVEDLDVKS